MISFQRYAAAQRELWDQFIRESKNGTFLFMRDYMDYHQDRFVDFSAIATELVRPRSSHCFPLIGSRTVW